MDKTLDRLWNMVNSIDTSRSDAMPKLWKAEEAIKASNIDNDQYDELMMTVAYLWREFYKNRRP